MRTKNQVNLKTSLFVSFASIIIFCVLTAFVFFAYRQIKRSINYKNYQQCLEEQLEANKTALSYVPRFINVKMNKRNLSISGIDHILIEGVINNSNIEKIELTSYSGDDSGLIKNFKQNQDGNFLYEINETSEGGAINPNFSINIIPKDNAIVCTSESDLAKTDVCTLKGLSLALDPENDNWCLDGIIDIGLGSAPIFALTDEEIQAIGLDKSNVCRQEPNSNWRNKCVNKN